MNPGPCFPVTWIFLDRADANSLSHLGHRYEFVSKCLLTCSSSAPLELNETSQWSHCNFLLECMCLWFISLNWLYVVKLQQSHCSTSWAWTEFMMMYSLSSLSSFSLCHCATTNKMWTKRILTVESWSRCQCHFTNKKNFWSWNCMRDSLVFEPQA